MTKQLIERNGRNRLKESLDGVPQIIEGLKVRLSRASSPAELQFYKEQIRLAHAYQVEMRSYTPELPDTTFTQSTSSKIANTISTLSSTGEPTPPVM